LNNKDIQNNNFYINFHPPDNYFPAANILKHSFLNISIPVIYKNIFDLKIQAFF
jgi:hypothetical protein